MNATKISNLFKDGKVNQAFSKLYELFPKAEKYILQNSGSKQEALDIFQEALIVLYKKYQSDNTIKLDGFLLNTCRFLWKNELRKKKIRQGSGVELEYLMSTDESEFILEQEQRFRLLEGVLRQVSAKCREIFKLFYIESLSMAKVAKKIGFKSVESAKVQKYKCMVYARNLVIQQKSYLKF